MLSTFLTENVAAMKSHKAIETFMNDELNELFVLDPPENFGDGMVTSMDGWRKLTGSRSGSKGKCVRFYTHSYTKNFATLTAGPTRQEGHRRDLGGIDEDDIARLSAFLKDADDIWCIPTTRSCRAVRSGEQLRICAPRIPALCLTDAAARSL